MIRYVKKDKAWQGDEKLRYIMKAKLCPGVYK